MCYGQRYTSPTYFSALTGMMTVTSAPACPVTSTALPPFLAALSRRSSMSVSFTRVRSSQPWSWLRSATRRAGTRLGPDAQPTSRAPAITKASWIRIRSWPRWSSMGLRTFVLSGRGGHRELRSVGARRSVAAPRKSCGGETTDMVAAHLTGGEPIGTRVAALRADARRVLDVAQSLGLSDLVQILFLQCSLIRGRRWRRCVRLPEDQGPEARRGRHRLGDTMPLLRVLNGLVVSRAQEHLALAGVAEADARLFRRSKTLPGSWAHAAEPYCAVPNHVLQLEPLRSAELE